MPLPAVQSMTTLSSLKPLMVRFWIALVFHPRPTRRAGAVPVAVALPASYAKSTSSVAEPMMDATAIGLPPGVPQYREVLWVGRIIVKLDPAVRSDVSGVPVPTSVTLVVLSTVPLADEEAVQPSV